MAGRSATSLLADLDSHPFWQRLDWEVRGMALALMTRFGLQNGRPRADTFPCGTLVHDPDSWRAQLGLPSAATLAGLGVGDLWRTSWLPGLMRWFFVIDASFIETHPAFSSCLGRVAYPLLLDDRFIVRPKGMALSDVAGPTDLREHDWCAAGETIQGVKTFSDSFCPKSADETGAIAVALAETPSRSSLSEVLDGAQKILDKENSAAGRDDGSTGETRAGAKTEAGTKRGASGKSGRSKGAERDKGAGRRKSASASRATSGNKGKSGKTRDEEQIHFKDSGCLAWDFKPIRFSLGSLQRAWAPSLSRVAQARLWQDGALYLADGDEARSRQTRAIMGKMIKTFGETVVAQALASVMTRTVRPADPVAFLRKTAESMAYGRPSEQRARKSRAHLPL